MGCFFVAAGRQVLGLRVCEAFASPYLRLHFRSRSKIGFAPGASNRTRPEWRVVTRYRSATVAGFHGLPRAPNQIVLVYWHDSHAGSFSKQAFTGAASAETGPPSR